MRHERIEINPGVMGGKPVVRGTRHAAQAFAADYLADEGV